VELLEGTLEARIVHLLLEMYPVTVEDLRRELRARADLLARTLTTMEKRGLVELEPLPDRTYVRLARMDFSFIGRKVTQQRRVKHSGKRPEKAKDYEGPMFG